MPIIILLKLFAFFSVCNSLSPHRAMILLSRYGYLTLPKLESLNNAEFERSLMIDGSYKRAIMKFQKTFKLPENGILSPKIERMLTAKRCGNPDYGSNPQIFRMNFQKQKTSNGVLRRIKRYFIDNPQMKWLKKDLTWKIKSYPSKNLTPQQVKWIFGKAFNKWSNRVNLNFVEERDYYKQADIMIEFGSGEHGDSIPFDGPHSVLAHAFYPSGTNLPLFSRAGDAHFDDDEEWVEIGRNLLAVAVHELGHSMGLGHSALEKAIMYPYYINPQDQEVDLDQDDILGMQSIYGAAEGNKNLPHIPDNPKDSPVVTFPVITTTQDPGKKINFCDTRIDAIIIIREIELYVFSGGLQWRIDFSKTVTSWISYELRDGPETINYYWPVLPQNMDFIDGGIERKDQKIYIFRNSRFWILEDNKKLFEGVPQEGLPLIKLGLPPSLKKIDTVFRWDHNKEIYIMSGDLYWKINEASGQFGYKYPRYPRYIRAVWKHVPLPVDVAFTGLHGTTFFIKDRFYYEFNNLEMKTDGQPKPLRTAWIGCKKPKN